MIQFFRKTKFQDKETTQLQDSVALILNQVTKKTLIDGVHVKNVALATGSNRFNHTLGRQPEGWDVVDRDAAADIFRSAWDANTITLDASAPVTIAIWIF